MLTLYQEFKFKYLFGFIIGFFITQTLNSQINESGLIKQEKIITYWNKDKNIIFIFKKTCAKTKIDTNNTEC